MSNSYVVPRTFGSFLCSFLSSWDAALLLCCLEPCILVITFLAQELLQTQGCCSLSAPMSYTENQLKAEKKRNTHTHTQQGTQGPSMSYLPSRILTLKYVTLCCFINAFSDFLNIFFIFCSSFLLQVSPMMAIACWGLFCLFCFVINSFWTLISMYMFIFVCVYIYIYACIQLMYTLFINYVCICMCDI